MAIEPSLTLAGRGGLAAMVSKESWIRYHLKLGPIGPLGRLALYAVAVIVALGVAWVLFGSSLAGLLLLLRSPAGS